MILVNGKETDLIPVSDRGLAYGDGLFETVAVRQSSVLLWDLHWQRLEAGCERLCIKCPEVNLVKKDIERLLDWESQSQRSRCVIKIIVTRGIGSRGYRIEPDRYTTRILQLGDAPEYPEDFYTQGVKCRICKTRLASQPLLAGIKHLNRLEQVLARMEWDDVDINEGIMLNSDNRVIEGTMSNIFFVTESGALETPRLTACGIAGVQRENIINIAQGVNIAVKETDIGINELGNYQESFLTNSLIGIWPVCSIEQQVFKPGMVTRSLQRALGI